VPIDDVDPVWFDRTYFLVPASAPAQRRPYVLLLEAMRETGTAALGRFILRGSENLCLIRAKGDALVLETMFVGEDVHSQAEIDEAVGDTEVKEPELVLARQVIDSLVGEFDPSELVSEYRRDMRAMLEAKLAGEEISVPEPEPEAPVVDLMEALRRSVAEIKDREDAPAKNKAAAKPRARKKAAAR
jgi:DNA end-binding protein Ku